MKATHKPDVAKTKKEKSAADSVQVIDIEAQYLQDLAEEEAGDYVEDDFDDGGEEFAWGGMRDFAAGVDFAPAPDLSDIHLQLVDADCGERMDKVLARLLPQFSRSRVQTWMEEGHVLVDGKPVKPRQLAVGDETVLVRPQSEPQHHAFAPEDIALEVVHEDESLLVIHKAAGLVVHPGAGNWSGTMLNGLLQRWPDLCNVPRAGIVHRLDKDTSGLMVVAKTLEAHTDLVRQLQARSVKREYFALVWGKPYVQGTVDKAMGRHPRERIKMATSTHASAKPAITHYQRLACGELDGRPVSLLRCSLQTGRTHQIRVHMAAIGFPLVGDALYGKSHLVQVFPRQALHAKRLGLIHPADGENEEWEVDLPQDMQDLLARAGITEWEE